jgi:hypothetical protein
MRFLRHIAECCGRADPDRHRLGGLQVYIRNDHLLRASSMKCLTKGTSDPASSSCYDDGFSGKLHSRMPM